MKLTTWRCDFGGPGSDIMYLKVVNYDRYKFLSQETRLLQY